MEPNTHYYGNTVRKLFVIAGLVMLATLPFLKTNISSPIFYVLLLILILAFFAGMTSPKYRGILVGDIVVSALGFAFFAYQAIARFVGFLDLFFVTNIVLAIIFLTAFYWGVKTIRGVEFSKAVIKSVYTRIKKEKPIPVSENTPTPERQHKELSEEERRRKRFLQEE